MIEHGYDHFVYKPTNIQPWTTENGDVVIPCRVDNPEVEDLLQVYLFHGYLTQYDCRDLDDTSCREVRKDGD
jgi:hypothetical protein